MANFGATALAVMLLAILLGIPERALALEPPTEGMELLARAKTLADKGQLFDPAVVAHAFPGDRPITAMDKTQTGVCGRGLQRRPEHPLGLLRLVPQHAIWPAPSALSSDGALG